MPPKSVPGQRDRRMPGGPLCPVQLLHAGDLITIRSAVLEMKEKSVRVIHEMRNDETGEQAATAKIVGVYIVLTQGYPSR